MAVKALRVRVAPTPEQQQKIDTTINCCRFIRNQMIERNNKIYERRGEHLNYNAMQNLLPEMKHYRPWLCDADAKALQYACRQVDSAYQRFFKKLGGYPKFSSKRDPVQSYTTYHPTSLRYEDHVVSLPKIGRTPALDKRNLPPDAKICQATVIRDHGQYFVSITYKTNGMILPHPIDERNVIGLDYKSDGLYVDSDGNKCNMPHWYRLSEAAIAKEQKKLSRKAGFRKGEKPSGNFKRQQNRLFKKTRHAANQRKDFLHKASAAIAKQYDAVCVEDLNMKAMSNKAFGNGKATLDNGYGMFLDMLEYKLADRGKMLIRVDKWFPSSQLCSNCGYQNPDVKDLRIRGWTCPVCGTIHDRDHNSAVNVKDEGLRIIKMRAA